MGTDSVLGAFSIGFLRVARHPPRTHFDRMPTMRQLEGGRNSGGLRPSGKTFQKPRGDNSSGFFQ
jgi:hypothetical protein